MPTILFPPCRHIVSFQLVLEPNLLIRLNRLERSISGDPIAANDGGDGPSVAPHNYDALNNVHGCSFHSSQASYFDGPLYGSWKSKMKIHLKSIDALVWQVVDVGYTMVDLANLTGQEERKEQANNTTSNAIVLSLCPSEFNQVEGLEKAKEIWDTLSQVHEGTLKVRES